MRALSCYAPVSNLLAAAHFSAKRTAQATSVRACVCVGGKEKEQEAAESFIMPVSIAADVERKSKNKNKNKNKNKQKHKHKPNARLNNLSHLLFARLARFAH